jgi:uncharacterized OB-fold protein
VAGPRPRPTPVSQPFWDGLGDEKVRLQRCDDCSTWVYYPRVRCPVCLSPRLSWHDVDGAGSVFTFTIARQATAPAFVDDVPQLLAVVAPEDVRIGLRVSPVFDHGEDGLTMLRFRPAT